MVNSSVRECFFRGASCFTELISEVTFDLETAGKTALASSYEVLQATVTFHSLRGGILRQCFSQADCF